MARLTLTALAPGDDLAITGPNADQTAWKAAGNGAGTPRFIDETNVRREGLDRRQFPAQICTVPPSGGQDRTYSGAFVTVTAGTAPTTTTAPTTISSACAIGPFSLDTTAGQRMRVMCSFTYKGSSAAGVNAVWQAKLGWSTNWNGATGDWTFLPRTVRKMAYSFDTVNALRGSLTIAHLFSGPTSTASLYFGLWIWEDVSGVPRPINVKDLRFFALTLKK